MEKYVTPKNFRIFLFCYIFLYVALSVLSFIQDLSAHDRNLAIDVTFFSVIMLFLAPLIIYIWIALYKFWPSGRLLYTLGCVIAIVLEFFLSQSLAATANFDFLFIMRPLSTFLLGMDGAMLTLIWATPLSNLFRKTNALI